VQQVANDRKGNNSHADHNRHGEKSFHDLISQQSLNSLKVYCHDLPPFESVIDFNPKINGPEAKAHILDIFTFLAQALSAMPSARLWPPTPTHRPAATEGSRPASKLH
jgi:hypothetical protein